ncbi:porphobilinogen synthase [uncultured Draconibacterium sp.]|uniref:porphobilinogen synthase n=1 Tax=uncultured Draconibacterium sp. TaxID=1573823 RepID=UPI003260C0D6
MMNRPQFPTTRLRRLRYNAQIRELVAETNVSLNDLVMPLFVTFGENVKQEITSMPGQYRFSVNTLVEKCKLLYMKGIKSVLLFGIPEEKDEHGHLACAENSIVQKAIVALKKELPGLLIIADVCNCEYTTHGHCGTIVDGDVENDSTLKTLVAQSVSLAQAGADIIAPSDMMDGRVKVIREALDEAGFYKVPIMAYSAKFASGFYGPFRDAADSAPAFGNRSTYQMDIRNSNEALREIEQDIAEGADMVMVKPGLAYLDIVARVKENFNIPVVVYNVSGEYSMVKAAAQNGWIDEQRVVMESMISFKRAGADVILTYWAETIADILKE